MAMMWAVPMASAGVCTTEVLRRLKEGRAGGLEGQMQGELWGLDWAQFGVLLRRLSEGMCNFRVGNLAPKPSGWLVSLIGASGLKPVPHLKNRVPS